MAHFGDLVIQTTLLSRVGRTWKSCLYNQGIAFGLS